MSQEGQPKKPNETAEFQEWLEGIRKQRYFVRFNYIYN